MFDTIHPHRAMATTHSPILADRICGCGTDVAAPLPWLTRPPRLGHGCASGRVRFPLGQALEHAHGAGDERGRKGELLSPGEH